MKSVHYSDYLQLEKILGAQQLESDLNQQHAHDEMLFIVIHQAYELWFKQILFEVESAIAVMKQPAVNDNSPELQTIVHRFNRCVTILKVLVQQIDIMETMTPMDFLDFRDMLRPASGFQSWQFKTVEARLGLKYEHRHGQEYYTSQLRPEQVQLIKEAEQDQSFLELLNVWLERMPFFDELDHWDGFEQVGESDGSTHPFWATYRNIYEQSLGEGERNNLAAFDELFMSGETKMTLSPKASRAALFIMLYRGYPMLQLPFQLLNSLLEIDEQLSTWRYRHMNMVHRIIGLRTGTGGSTGKAYLKGALDKHYIFKDIAQLTSFLIERRRLPKLTSALAGRLGFVSA
jgi:tryptophan 2,3-dioxygenase